MNTIKKSHLFFIAIFALLALNSCVQDDDFANPPANCNDVWVSNLTIQDIFNQVEAADDIVAYDTDQIFEGYVVSSDSTGNFFKTISVQNDPTNPTKALQVEMDRTNLFNNFPLGSKVKVNLNGLHAGYDNAALKIGDTYDDEGNIRVGRMADHKIDSHVSITCDGIFGLTPISFPSIAAAKASGIINTLIRIENVQFQNVGVTYADAQNQATVNRIIQGATAETKDQSIILRNSGYATFAGDLLPEGSGAITAVLSKYNSDWQLFIRDTQDVQFNNPRYEIGNEPGDGPIGGSDNSLNSCLNETFETFNANDEEFSNYINDAAWGGFYWQVRSFSNNKYIQFSSHNSGDQLNVAYFVVPVDDAADSFSFKTKDGYNNGNVLSVFYTNDYVWGQSVESATLQDITSNFNISSGNTSGYGANFVDSGSFNLSGFSGAGYIVFKYEGNQNVDTTMQIDDIRIIDNEDPDCTDGGGTEEEPELGAGFLFPGADFENWQTFLDGLNSFGIQAYATQGSGNGFGGGNSLTINTPGAVQNDYVFTTLAHSQLPNTYSTVKFKMKGSSEKSVSLNLYKTDGEYYKFNLGDVSTSVTLTPQESNQYTGVINTNGEWIEITLDLTGITDLNTNANTSANFFALKIGKEKPYDLYFDDFTIQ